MAKLERAAGEGTAGRPYFRALDGIRALAAVMVMAFHFCQDRGILGLAVFGQTGVDLFFVLSGFLITTILLVAPGNDWQEVRTFYVRRTLRIFPLYYGYLLVSTILFGPQSKWYWSYLANIPLSRDVPLVGPMHFWSLGIEEQFYLVWPFLVLFLPRRFLVRTLWGIIAIAVLCRLVVIPMHISPLLFTVTRLDGLSAGALLAVYSSTGQLRRWRGMLMPLAGACAVVLFAQWWWFRGQGTEWVLVTKFSVMACFYAAVIGYVVLSGRTLLNRFLESKPMRWVGRVSYGLYVFHPAIYYHLERHVLGWPMLVQIAVCFGSVLGAALLSWHLYEKWFIRLKDTLAPERRRVEAPAAV